MDLVLGVGYPQTASHGLDRTIGGHVNSMVVHPVLIGRCTDRANEVHNNIIPPFYKGGLQCIQSIYHVLYRLHLVRASPPYSLRHEEKWRFVDIYDINKFAK